MDCRMYVVGRATGPPEHPKAAHNQDTTCVRTRSILIYATTQLAQSSRAGSSRPRRSLRSAEGVASTRRATVGDRRPDKHEHLSVALLASLRRFESA